jgi:hypothetical protein
MVATPRRRKQAGSAASATIRVGYPPGPDGRDWDVPFEVYQVGEAKRWIEQQIQAERDAERVVKSDADDALAQEFKTIKRGMGELTAMREQIGLLEQALASRVAADKARQEELASVRSAADQAIGVGNSAVAVTRDLNLASSSAADLLDRLRTTANQLETNLERAFADYDAKIEALAVLAKQQGNTLRNQQQAFQVIAAKLEDKVATLESKVSKADVTAQDALTTAQSAQRSNSNGNDIQTAADNAAATAMQEWETSSDTATIRKLIGTDARTLDHLAVALKSMKDQDKDLGGTSVQDAAVVAMRLIDRIRQAQEFKDGQGQEYSFEPDTPNGRGGAAKSAAAAGRGPDRKVGPIGI